MSIGKPPAELITGSSRGISRDFRFCAQERDLTLFAFYEATQVRFGPGALGELGPVVRQYGACALIVTGRSVARQSGLLDRVEGLLTAAGVECQAYAEVEVEPPSHRVDHLAATIADGGFDVVVALGGGSPLDAAKLAAAIVTNGGTCLEYERGRQITKPIVPIIAVPTTAGTGSEVTPYSVINDLEIGRKFTVTNRLLCPVHAVVDPALTRSLPKEQTVATGLDAFVHALEAYLSNKPNPIIDPWAEATLRTIGRYLGRAVEHPEDLVARTAMSRAALLGGLIITNVRTGMVHTMSAAIAMHVHIPHGWLNALLTPWVLKFNAGSYPEDRLYNIASWVSGRETFNGQLDAVEDIERWLRGLGIQGDLRGYTFQADIIERLIDRLYQDKGLPTVNVRPFKRQEVERLFRSVVYPAGAS